MKGLKIFSIQEWALSHIFLIGGLALVTVGLSLKNFGFIIGGIWSFAGGLCFVTYFITIKLLAR